MCINNLASIFDPLPRKVGDVMYGCPFCKCQLEESDNLQYNMVGYWDDSMIVLSSDAPMFGLRSYQTVNKELYFTYLFSSFKILLKKEFKIIFQETV